MKALAALNGCAAYAPEFDGGLSNHLPMTLVALERLGADEQRLAAFAAAYATRLEPAPPVQPWPVGDPWPDRLGQPESWPAYRSLFAEWIPQEGAVDMLAQVLPQLMSGVGAAAFHGLIRTAHALRCGHLAELADALAYWACRHLWLGAMDPDTAVTARAPATDDPVALLRELRRGRSGAQLIFEQMRDAALDGRVNRVAARLRIDEGTPQRLARAAALAYAHTGNFVALHLVTGTHAMRLVTRFVDDPLAAWGWYWQAYAHAVVAARLQPLPPAPLRTWKTLVTQALASNDEHVVKLVECCREEEKAYAGRGEALWREAASRAVEGH